MISRGKKIILITSGSVIILIILVFVVVHYVSGPAQGRVSNNLAPIANQASSFNLTPVNVIGKYIVFDYPASLIPDTSSTNSGTTPESYLYKFQDLQPWLLAISVNKLSQPSLNYDSSFSIRKLDPSRYQESTRVIGSNTFYVFKDLSTSGFSQTAFVINGTKSVDISLYGNDQSGFNNLSNTFNMVLNSFEWKV